MIDKIFYYIYFVCWILSCIASGYFCYKDLTAKDSKYLVYTFISIAFVNIFCLYLKLYTM